MNCTVRFGNCLLRVPPALLPCALLPSQDWGKHKNSLQNLPNSLFCLSVHRVLPLLTQRNGRGSTSIRWAARGSCRRRPGRCCACPSCCCGSPRGAGASSTGLAAAPIFGGLQQDGWKGEGNKLSESMHRFVCLPLEID